MRVQWNPALRTPAYQVYLIDDILGINDINE